MKRLVLLCFGGLAILLAGCTPIPTITVQPTRVGEFTPLPSATPSPTVTPTSPFTATPLPTPTSTPRTHVVKSDEDMFGIALRYGVPVEVIKTLNPTVDPRMMSVGTILLLPEMTPQPPGEATPTATAAPLQLGAPDCLPDAGGGWWCFLTASSETRLENVAVLIHFTDPENGQEAAATATLPLNVLPAGQPLPLAAHFAGPRPAGEPTLQIVSALPLAADDPRYVTVQIENTVTEIAPPGKWAVVSGQVALGEGGTEARWCRVLAVAYDEAGHVIGLRWWDSPAPLSPGDEAEFSFTVYAVAGRIAQVALFAEAGR